MAPTARERSVYRQAWRRLATDALEVTAAIPSGPISVKSELRAARDWVCPTEDAGECAVCAALATMFVAFARCARVGQRVDLAPGLIQWARLVLAILDRAEAAAPLTPAPYRAPYAED